MSKLNELNEVLREINERVHAVDCHDYNSSNGACMSGCDYGNVEQGDQCPYTPGSQNDSDSDTGYQQSCPCYDVAS